MNYNCEFKAVRPRLASHLQNEYKLVVAMFTRVFLVALLASYALLRDADAQVQVSLPEIVGDIGQTDALIPLGVGDLTSLGITGYVFTVEFDPEIISIHGISQGLTLSDSPVIVVANAKGDSIKVAASRTVPFSGDGILLNLVADYLAPGTSPLTIRSFRFSPPNIATAETTDGSVENVVLAVDLSSFDAATSAGVVSLKWTTLSEDENTGFEVEHRTEITTYRRIGFVDGIGTSRATKNYTFQTESISPGLHFFRLKQFDSDGSFTYGPEIEVFVDVIGGSYVSVIFPNPATTEARLEVVLEREEAVSLEIVDMLGRRIEMQNLGVLSERTRHQVNIGVSNLGSGTYVYRLVGKSFVRSGMFVVAK